MGKLLKYEFIKMRRGIMMFVLMTIVVQLAYMIGVWRLDERFLMIGVTGLMIVALSAIVAALTYNINQFQVELNTKQSYMIFLTPNNRYTIFASKVITAVVLFVVTGIVYSILAYYDVSFLVADTGTVENEYGMIQFMVMMIGLDQLPLQWFIAKVITLLLGIVSLMATGYLAVELEMIAMNGKKASGWISVILIILLVYGEYKAVGLLSGLLTGYTADYLAMGLWLIITAVTTYVGSYILDRKISI